MSDKDYSWFRDVVVPTLKASTFKEFESKLSPEPEVVERKNMNLARKIVGTFAYFKTEMFSLEQAEWLIGKFNWDNCWDRDPKAMDGTGLRRTLGDLFGGHGLKLETTMIGRKKYYRIPKELL